MALDDLRLAGVVAVICMHAFEGYSQVGDWVYQDVPDVRLDPDLAAAIGAVVAPGVVVAMPLFFTIAGLVAPGSLRRRGPRAFVRERVGRLGGQAILASLCVWPLTVMLLHGATGSGSWSYATVLSDARPVGDNGPAWMLPVLAVLCLVFALTATTTIRLHRAPASARTLLLVVAALVAATTYLVRLRFPAGSQQVGNLHLWQWPQLVGAFAIGVAGAARGWHHSVPAATSRLAGAMATVGTLTVWSAVALAVATSPDSLVGGNNASALLWAAGEGLVSVAGPVVLVAIAQRARSAEGGGSRSLRRRLHAASFPAFLVQGPVLVAAALALRPLDLPAAPKLVVVATVASVVCLGLGLLVAAPRRWGRPMPRGLPSPVGPGQTSRPSGRLGAEVDPLEPSRRPSLPRVTPEGR